MFFRWNCFRSAGVPLEAPVGEYWFNLYTDGWFNRKGAKEWFNPGWVFLPGMWKLSFYNLPEVGEYRLAGTRGGGAAKVEVI